APAAASALVGELALLVPMAGLIEPASELQRLERRMQRLEKDLALARRNLANEHFVSKAPAAIVLQERERLAGGPSAPRGPGPARPGATDRAGALDGGSVSSLDATISAVERVIIGKGTQVRLCLACLLARGHLLIEDVPGVGKTTLAQTLARVLGLEWSRLQF